MGTNYKKQVTVITRAVAIASAQSAAFPEDTLAIDLYSDVLCYVQVNDNPTATTAAPSVPITPFQWHPAMFLSVDGAKEGGKIAAIRDTTDGTLWIRITTGPRP